MKNLIVCFSGTGNSFYIAKRIQESMEDCKISFVTDITEDNFVMPERLGFVFPIHAFFEPILIDNFIENILVKNNEKNKLQYIYSIANSAAGKGFFSLNRIERLLKKNGITTTYSNAIEMPSNYLNVSTVEKAEKTLNKVENKLLKIIDDIKNEEIKFPKKKPNLFEAICRTLYNSMLRHFWQGYNVNNSCNSCGLCVQNCPTNSIVFENGKIKYKDTCIGCTFCINSCPQNAISRNKKYEQYLNPRVNIFKMHETEGDIK